MKPSLVITNPDCLKYWSPNNTLDPNELHAGSEKKALWIGDCSHEWEMQIKQKIKRGYGCPYCRGLRVLQGFNDLATKSPEIAKELNVKLTGKEAFEIVNGSKLIAWWTGNCGHTWDMKVNKRTKDKANCPYCSFQRVLPGFNDLKSQKPSVAKYWSSENTLSPEKVYYNAGAKFWWKNPCNHISYQKIYFQERYGCSICREDNNRNMSFGVAHPNLVALLAPENKFDPFEVNANSSFMTSWLWPCGHGEERRFSQIVSNSECRVCTGKKLVSGINDFATLYPELMTQWDPENTINPRQVKRTSLEQVQWICVKNHRWTTAIKTRTNGAGCPNCKQGYSNLEYAFEQELQKLSLNYLKNKRPLFVNKKLYEIDFYLPELNLAFEIQDFASHSISSNSEPRIAFSPGLKNGPAYHENKRTLAREHLNTVLIDIWEDEIVNQYYKNILYSVLNKSNK